MPVDVVYTWVDGGDPDWYDRQQERLAAWAGAVRRPRRRAPRAAAPVSRAATSCATRCAACTSSRRGSAPSTSSPTRRCPPWLDVVPPAGPGGRPPRHPAGRGAADVQLARHRERPAPDPRPGRALRLLQRRHAARSAASAPSGSSTPRAGSRSSPPRTSSGSATRTASRPTSPRPCATAGSSRRPSASRSPTTSCTRRTRSGSRCSPRSPTGSPTEVEATAHAPFRSETDVSMVSSLAPHYGLMTGTAYEAEHREQLRRPGDAPTSGWCSRTCCSAGRTPSAWATTTTTRWRWRRVDRLVADFFERYLPDRGAVGE